MRSDMQKLICERPRRGSSNPSLKTGLKLDPNIEYSDDFDSGPIRAIGTKKTLGWNKKNLNENLNPLYNFLRTAVGRSWDDVYSEIRSNIDLRKAIGLHVMQHVMGRSPYVHLNVFMQNGKPFGAGYGHENGEEFGLYVNPETGILCDNPRSTHISPPKPVTKIHWSGSTYFELETVKKAPCGCYSFHKLPDQKWDDKREYCQHHLMPTFVSSIWYVVSYRYHMPNEVFKVIIFWDGNPQNKKYGLTKEGQTHYIYYRDVPEEMAKPFLHRKKTANKKELKAIRKALLANQSSPEKNVRYHRYGRYGV